MVVCKYIELARYRKASESLYGGQFHIINPVDKTKLSMFCTFPACESVAE